MKKYSEFLKSLNEASGKNFIDVIDEDKPFNGPVYKIHRDDLIDEMEGFLERVKKGTLERVTVFADVPTSGKRRPAYLADVLPEVTRQRTPDPIDRPEGDVPDDVNVFVDVEFEVIDVDVENNMIVAMPYSLRRKKITTPIDPRDVQEVYYKKSAQSNSLAASLRKETSAPALPQNYNPSIEQE
jgi:hypothetical protein